MMEFYQSLAIVRSVPAIIATIREREVPAEASTSEPEEVFVPFRLPPVKPRPMAETQPPVAVPASKSIPVAV